MKRGVWRWIALFAYRRWARAVPRKPVGVPFNRDPQHPCDSYEPRKRQLGDWADCQTDGHYLCAGCCHRDPDGPAQGRDWLHVYSVEPR